MFRLSSGVASASRWGLPTRPAPLLRVSASRLTLSGSSIPELSIPRTFSLPSRLLSTSTRQLEKCCAKKNAESKPESTPVPMTSRAFWASAPVWRRSSINTLRCLIGCTMGDFSALWFLQAFYPGLGMSTIMAISMASGLTTSMLFETTLLRFSRDKLPWGAAARTAAGMSFISMLTMETVQNILDYHLTGGLVDVSSPDFWVAALVSMGAGYLAPLPYNYIRLRRYGKACH
ncbi:uncharacterized protein DNG_07866 [Cephalotrichum gorgonifer]|uniref:DUF4396 domain-containing protein n=1 Tax=Cephalotrichum gorgonifer TaxID=2041049 RepID=A0AAE8N2M4_9PEZI|nr:uncharacterized protein DNG_07866 [Cephalotrichum gorgonifer]